MTMSAGWYLRRLSRMGPQEVAGRVGDTVRRRRWRSAPPACPSVTGARFTAVLPAEAIAAVPPDAAKRLIAEAQAGIAKQAVVANAAGEIAEPLVSVGAQVKAGAAAVRVGLAPAGSGSAAGGCGDPPAEAPA